LTGWKSWNLKGLNRKVASSRLNAHARNPLRSITTAEKGFLSDGEILTSLRKLSTQSACEKLKPKSNGKT